MVASAFYQRSNFYSAMVHLAQNNISLIVLANLALVIYGLFMYSLQRLCFGPLRVTEIEQLYEKAWFAVTETCLAMTIFRDEIGGFFLIMFTALVTGKVWGWIGEGRIEALEQQPPANPRLFHTRLAVSLLASLMYDIWLLRYAIYTVIRQARPTMMVMFLFEFAILLVCSLHTTTRYGISIMEQHVNKTQTRQRLEERRRQVREQRLEAERRRAQGNAQDDDAEIPHEDNIDEMDIEVPGWENKGQWILILDLVADFVKLMIYTAFFCVILTFYNLPIHIIRDWFMTTRSFLKRLHALIRYRQAIKHMDQYPDATAEDLGRDNTCIICREEMRPWDATVAGQVERTRTKKLPCGHILHLGCLKSWLERQQVCPTCRRPVNRENQQGRRNGEAMVFRFGLNFPPNRQAQAPVPPANGQAQPAQGPEAPANQPNNQGRGVRMFNLGPVRFGFAQGAPEDINEMAQQLGMPLDPNRPAPTPTVPIAPQAPAVPVDAEPAAPAAPAEAGNVEDVQTNMDHIRAHIVELARRVQQEAIVVNQTAHELQVWQHTINSLHHAAVEIARARQATQQQPAQRPAAPAPQAAPAAAPAAANAPVAGGQAVNWQVPNAQPAFPQHLQGFQQQVWVQHNPWYQHHLQHHQQHAWPQQQQFHHVLQPPVTQPGTIAVPRTLHTINRRNRTVVYQAGDPGAPEGLVLPPGWSLLPLSRSGDEDGLVNPAHEVPPAVAPVQPAPMFFAPQPGPVHAPQPIIPGHAPQPDEVHAPQPEHVYELPREIIEPELHQYEPVPPADLHDRLAALVPEQQNNIEQGSSSSHAPAVDDASTESAGAVIEGITNPLLSPAGWDWRDLDEAEAGPALHTPGDELENAPASSSATGEGEGHGSGNETTGNPRAVTVEEADENDNSP
ncbi:E3 ubiquitin-protein ligase HRD1 [Podospora fimiseda]|uniref:RING-type E3 ubiquitin transferase n=1 Tax=Podospora fimiseda TaxID=252190 RepID=A0AAN7GYF3_9PEZI|nr:E3 ubiquitin-protein ligase HRD1 [Podospora fimiseda]